MTGVQTCALPICEAKVEEGGVIQVRIDDAPTPTSEYWVTSTFQGVTLRVIELGGAISEIQVSPGAFDWVTDLSGNKFKIGPVDTGLTQDEWLTVNANSGSDSLWNVREGLGSYGPILESFPKSGEDAPTLQTSVIFAQGGTYDVFFSLGDIGPVDPDENLRAPTPVNFAFEGEELTRWHPNDGTFNGSPGYNDYEMSVGQITVAVGETRSFIIDDVQDGTAIRSVYLGMRFETVEDATDETVLSIAVEPAVDDPTQNQITLAWPSSAGALYTVEASEDLTNWSVVAENVPSAGDNTTYSEPLDPGRALRFYRLMQ